jgi:hypothetical protein
MELTREQIKNLLHSATGNVRDFVMDEDGFIDDWIKRNRVEKNVVLDNVSKSLPDPPSTTHVIGGIECTDREFQGWRASSFDTISDYLYAIGK